MNPSRRIILFVTLFFCCLFPVSCRDMELEWVINLRETDSTNLYERPNADIQDLFTLYSLVSGILPVEETRDPKSTIKSLKMWRDWDDTFAGENEFPVFMMDYDAGEYYWTVNGDWLLSGGKRIPVGSVLMMPKVQYTKEEWRYSCGGSPWEPISPVKADSSEIIQVKNTDSNLFFTVVFPSGHKVTLPTRKGVEQINRKVPQRAFYKDMFLDSGIGLKKWKNLYAAKYLGLFVEGTLYEEKEDYVLQSRVIAGGEMDDNGWLLYPDGQPRYRLLFVVGGNALTHGTFLGEQGLNAMRTFIRNGGAYVGTCAGAFFVSNGNDLQPDNEYYLNMWPGLLHHSRITSASIGMTLPESSPLLKYYDYGGDSYVAGIRHIKGGFAVNMPEGTEVIASVDYPQNESFHKQPAIWAYKENDYYGRICMTGSHPEMTASGEVRDLTAAIIRYALEGQGFTTIKGFLNNGETRTMDKTSSDNYPAYARIGDKQCHHFAVIVPEGAQNVSVALEGAPDYDLTLMMDPETYAYPDVAKYISDTSGPIHTLAFDELEAGLWFIAVQCLTTVEVNDFKYGQEYSGRTDVLNGVPYSITVTWDTNEQTADE